MSYSENRVIFQSSGFSILEVCHFFKDFFDFRPSLIAVHVLALQRIWVCLIIFTTSPPVRIRGRYLHDTTMELIK